MIFKSLLPFLTFVKSLLEKHCVLSNLNCYYNLTWTRNELDKPFLTFHSSISGEVNYLPIFNYCPNEIFCIFKVILMCSLNIIVFWFVKNVFVMPYCKEIIFSTCNVFFRLYLKTFFEFANGYFVSNCYHDDVLYSIIRFIPLLKRL